MKYFLILVMALTTSVYAKDITVKNDLARSLFLSLEQSVKADCDKKSCEIALDQLACAEVFRKVRCTVGVFSNGKVLLKYIRGQEAKDISDALYDIRDASCPPKTPACGSHFYNVSCKEKKKFFSKSYKCELSDIK